MNCDQHHKSVLFLFSTSFILSYTAKKKKNQKKKIKVVMINIRGVAEKFFSLAKMEINKERWNVNFISYTYFKVQSPKHMVYQTSLDISLKSLPFGLD